MPEETRTSTRVDQTPSVVQTKRKGMNRARKLSTTGTGEAGAVVITIPPRADCIIIENEGTNPIRFVFGVDNFTNAFDLPIGSPRIEFPVNPGIDITVRSTGGVGDIQYILSG